MTSEVLCVLLSVLREGLLFLFQTRSVRSNYVYPGEVYMIERYKKGRVRWMSYAAISTDNLAVYT
ncbi:hypothetical protein V2J09_022938 [Rumex salicifolius]